MTNFCGRNSCNSSARAAVWSYVYVIASYLGSNRILKIFNSKWSYDKMLIDWVRSGWTGKHLALGQDVRTSLRSIRRPRPRAKYFPVRPSHSVNKYIIPSPRSLSFREKHWERARVYTRAKTSEDFGSHRTSSEDFGLLRESWEMIVSFSKFPALPG